MSVHHDQLTADESKVRTAVEKTWDDILASGRVVKGRMGEYGVMVFSTGPNPVFFEIHPSKSYRDDTLIPFYAFYHSVYRIIPFRIV